MHKQIHPRDRSGLHRGLREFPAPSLSLAGFKKISAGSTANRSYIATLPLARHTGKLSSIVSYGSSIMKRKYTAVLDNSQLVFSVSEVAGLLGISRGTVYSLIDSGALRSLRITKPLRISRNAIDEFLNDRERIEMLNIATKVC